MKKYLFLLFAFLIQLVYSQSEARFDSATVAYNKGDYEKAIAYYKEILGEGKHSAALYYNLGNSFYKLNQIAPSIYYYEKALLLAPNDPEIKNNLVYAQNMTLDAI
ncbi:MAG: tetratricopeptide repeat protein, partial [Eudoraea sp.]|nr:tetratricopeptide repeat protein [Eudoraea sp.]